MTKRRIILWSALSVLIISSGIVFLRWEPESDLEAAFGDPALVRLPDDQKAARAELRKARKAIAQLRPSGTYIVINRHSNTIVLRNEEHVIFRAVCSTGSGGELTDKATGRRWIFQTPTGVFKVESKLVNPWWRKPDWAFIEENEAAPEDEKLRFDPEMLGEYAMGFGDGYFIHGTIYERLLGVSVTHGCVRVGSEDLKYLYDCVKIGTPIYVF